MADGGRVEHHGLSTTIRFRGGPRHRQGSPSIVAECGVFETHGLRRTLLSREVPFLTGSHSIVWASHPRGGFSGSKGVNPNLSRLRLGTTERSPNAPACCDAPSPQRESPRNRTKRGSVSFDHSVQLLYNGELGGIRTHIILLCANRLGNGANTSPRRVILLCANCNAQTNNPKFCSRSCSAIYTNRQNPRRLRTKRCKGCGSLILAAWTYCSPECRPSAPPPLANRTLGEVQGRAAYQVNAQIRDAARRIMKRTRTPKECRVCGYNTHVEVSHIRAISSFSSDTLVSEINHPSNISFLGAKLFIK